jgi:hypothetical protein
VEHGSDYNHRREVPALPARSSISTAQALAPNRLDREPTGSLRGRTWQSARLTLGARRASGGGRIRPRYANARTAGEFGMGTSKAVAPRLGICCLLGRALSKEE